MQPNRNKNMNDSSLNTFPYPFINYDHASSSQQEQNNQKIEQERGQKQEGSDENNQDNFFLPFSKEEETEEDLRWSFLSNSWFIAGGSTYVGTAVWDNWFASQDPTLFYFAMVALGPMLYLINGAIDVAWSLRIRERNKANKSSRKSFRPIAEGMGTTTIENMNMHTTSSNLSLSTPQEKKVVQHSTREKERIEMKKQRSFNEVFVIRLYKARKYAAHRRDLYAATTFALAAFLAVVDWYDGVNNIQGFSNIPFDGLSFHIYLLSALFALTGKRSKPRSYRDLNLNDSECLEDMGDLFFLFGSLIDVVLYDFTFDDNVPIWTFVSAITWFVDALLYLRSDVVQSRTVVSR